MYMNIYLVVLIYSYSKFKYLSVKQRYTLEVHALERRKLQQIVQVYVQVAVLGCQIDKAR